MTKRKSPLDGLKITVTYVDSGKTAGRKPRVKVPPVNVAALRAKTGLSQFEFAQSIGVPKGTLLNWEQGRREPTGPAQVLLAILAKKPSLVKDLFANRHVYQPEPDRPWSPGGPHPDDMTPEERMAEICQILGLGLARLHQKNAKSITNYQRFEGRSQAATESDESVSSERQEKIQLCN